MRARVVEASEATHTAWRQLLRRRILRGVARGLYWTLVTFAMLLGGDGGLPDAFEDVPNARLGRRIWRAHLALSRTTGRQRMKQASLTQDTLSSVRRATLLVPGVVWFSDGGPVWVPNARWRYAGASESMAPLDAVREIEIAPLRRESLGVVFRETGGDELWLWVRGTEVSRFMAELTDRCR
jgi:hypothetical protein